MTAIQATKSKFLEIIKHIDNDPEINNQFSPEMRAHLKQLHQLWQNNDDANIEYYFKMKDHHCHINGRIENETLKTRWDDYLVSCSSFRCDLLSLNMLGNNLT